MKDTNSLSTKGIIFALLTLGLIACVFWILSDPQAYEAWVTFISSIAGWFGSFTILANEVLEKRYRKNNPALRQDIPIQKYDTAVPDVDSHKKELAVIRRPLLRPFVFVALGVVSAAVGAAALALVTLDYSETLYYVLLLPALLGSVLLALSIDIGFHMEQQAAIIVRLVLSVLLGGIGAFVGILAVSIGLLVISSGDTGINGKK